MNREYQLKLQEYYASAYPAWDQLHVSRLTSISNGWESEMYSFHLEYNPANEPRREDLILRIYPGDHAQDKAIREFNGMQKLHHVGYPVPEVYLLETERSPFAKPFVIMEKIAGKEMWDIIARARKGDQVSSLAKFTDLLVRLHRLDWRPFTLSADVISSNPYIFIDYWLNEGGNFIQQFNMPGLIQILDWLRLHRNDVPCFRPAVVHQDFHPNNVLLSADGSMTVIDWTQVEVSDPRLDLAWTLMLTGAHHSLEWRRIILENYEGKMGSRVEGLEVFEVIACLKRIGSVLISLSASPERLGMRPDAVALIKRDIHGIKGVYGFLVERTGIRVPEVEKFLEGIR